MKRRKKSRTKTKIELPFEKSKFSRGYKFLSICNEKREAEGRKKLITERYAVYDNKSFIYDEKQGLFIDLKVEPKYLYQLL